MFVKRLKKPLFLTSDRLKLEHNGQELFSKLNSMMFLVCVLDRKYFPGTTIWGYSIGEVKLLWILSSFVKGISMQKNFNYLIYVIHSLDVFCLHRTECISMYVQMYIYRYISVYTRIKCLLHVQLWSLYQLITLRLPMPWFPQCIKKEYGLHATVCVLRFLLWIW